LPWSSPLIPYTTLFRSDGAGATGGEVDELAALVQRGDGHAVVLGLDLDLAGAGPLQPAQESGDVLVDLVEREHRDDVLDVGQVGGRLDDLGDRGPLDPLGVLGLDGGDLGERLVVLGVGPHQVTAVVGGLRLGDLLDEGLVLGAGAHDSLLARRRTLPRSTASVGGEGPLRCGLSPPRPRAPGAPRWPAG